MSEMCENVWNVWNCVKSVKMCEMCEYLIKLSKITLKQKVLINLFNWDYLHLINIKIKKL